MMLLDLISYLPDDILAKVNRASMAVSLEARVPLLDHRVVEFAARLPLSMKIRGGRGKWLLRQLLDEYVPRALIERPKMGFAVPLDEWLRDSLREWAENLLGEQCLRAVGFLRSGAHSTEVVGASERDAQLAIPALWDVLQFQAWLEHWGP